MADPVQAPPDNHSNISNDLQASLADLAHKHVHVSYALIGVIVCVLALGGVFAFYSNKSYEKAMERAEAAEKQMLLYKQQSDDSNKQFQSQLATDQAQRAADTQKIMDLESKISAQQAAANAAIGNALKPGKSAQEAFTDLSGAYKGVLAPALNLSKDDKGEQLLGFRVPEVQRFTADKIDLDSTKNVLSEKQQELVTKDGTIVSLNKDLKAASDNYSALSTTELKCEETVKAYKAVAVKTRWQKIWAGTKKGLEIGAAILAGYKLGKL